MTGSLYECLRAHGVIPSSAVHDISMGHATPFVSKHLHTEVGDALLVLDELVLNQHGEPLHLSRQWIRGDKFTFRICITVSLPSGWLFGPGGCIIFFFQKGACVLSALPNSPCL